MDSTDLTRLQRRVRWAYERRRAWLALVGVLPFSVVVAVAACMSPRPMSAICFGIVTGVVSATMLWYGRGPQKAVFPGIVAGLVPLVLALCANHMHACGADSCSSLCVPACTLGGVVAGLAVASVGTQRNAGFTFWMSASVLAVLTGSMGCACVGYSGIAGLGVGFVAGMVPSVLRGKFGKKQS